MVCRGLLTYLTVGPWKGCVNSYLLGLGLNRNVYSMGSTVLDLFIREAFLSIS